MTQPILTIVVPCYNEEEVLPETVKRLSAVLQSLIEDKMIDKQSLILFVDDGSRDKTWTTILEESLKNAYVAGLKLTRNFGHQKALLAGLACARSQADCVVSIDADLQDDVSVIRQFVIKFREGYDIVYGVRENRDSDTFFKRTTAQWFYNLMGKLGIRLVYNHADYRLMSRRALDILAGYQETNLFLRGIVPMIGLPSATVFYERKERYAGKSKYPLKKMLAFALEGITSFSVAPIRWIVAIGFLSLVLSCVAGGYALLQNMLGHTQSGWTSLMISIWMIGGLLLMGVGVVGEYVGKIYQEVKHRPQYIVEIDLLAERGPGRIIERESLEPGRVP